MPFPFILAAANIAEAIGLGLEINGYAKDAKEVNLTNEQRKEAFIAEVNNMPYLSKWTIVQTGDKDRRPNDLNYFGLELPNDDWFLIPEDTPGIIRLTEGRGWWQLNLYSDGAGNLVNWTRAKELIAAESTQGCNEGEKHAYYFPRKYYNPYIEDFLDYERLGGDTPMIIGCCPEKFNGLQCVPYGTENTVRTPQQAANFDCRVLNGKNYDGVLHDPNHTDIDLPFTFDCRLNAESQAKVDFQDCMKQGGSYESCQLGGTTTTTNNGVSDAIDYMMTIDEGGEDDEEEEIETPPPDTTTPPPTDTGMSDADRERLNNYRRRRF
jgi:hypothetical protein